MASPLHMTLWILEPLFLPGRNQSNVGIEYVDLVIILLLIIKNLRHMQKIPIEIIELALGKSDGEPLTNDELAVCDEWATGIASEYMKVDTSDPRILDYCRVWDNCEDKKDEVWKGIIK